jgi:hypothetical protein
MIFGPMEVVRFVMQVSYLGIFETFDQGTLQGYHQRPVYYRWIPDHIYPLLRALASLGLLIESPHKKNSYRRRKAQSFKRIIRRHYVVSYYW